MVIKWGTNPLINQVREAIRNVDVPGGVCFRLHPNGAVSIVTGDLADCVLRDWEVSSKTLTWRAMACPPFRDLHGHYLEKRVPVTGNSAEEVLKIAAAGARMGVFDEFD